MTLSLLIAPLLLLAGADAPKPKLITPAGGVVKVDPAADPVWNEVTADPIQTTLESPAKSRWVIVTAGCKVTPVDDGKRAVFAAAKAGRYLLVVLPEAGEPVLVAVLVGKVDPPPKPDDPPVPPPVPVPVSDLGKRFQAEFDKDAREAAKKRSDLADLVELYRQAGDLAASADVTTTGQLVARVRDASKALGIEGLADLRRAISVELATAMPADEALSAELRTKAKSVFSRIQFALKEVK